MFNPQSSLHRGSNHLRRAGPVGREAVGEGGVAGVCLQARGGRRRAQGLRGLWIERHPPVPDLGQPSPGGEVGSQREGDQEPVGTLGRQAWAALSYSVRRHKRRSEIHHDSDNLFSNCQNSKHT